MKYLYCNECQRFPDKIFEKYKPEKNEKTIFIEKEYNYYSKNYEVVDVGGEWVSSKCGYTDYDQEPKGKHKNIIESCDTELIWMEGAVYYLLKEMEEKGIITIKGGKL